MSPPPGRRNGRRAPAPHEGARLRLARLARGLSQEELARAAGVSRQAVAGIEAGQWDPSLRVGLAIARALESRVEELFGPAEELDPVDVVPLGPGGATGRVDLVQVGTTTVAIPLDGEHTLHPGFAAAGGLRAGPGPGWPGSGGEASPDRRWRVRPTRPPGSSLVVAGCDPAISLLAGPLSTLDPPVSLSWWPCASGAALTLAATGLVHAAGAHAPELPGGRVDIDPLVPAGLAEAGFEAVAFTAWEEGIASRQEVGPVDLSAVASAKLRFLNRQPGSEARALVDAEMARNHLGAADIDGFHTAAGSHLLVAAAVAAGAADAGVTIEPAALAYGLAFAPLASERFLLFLPSALLGLAEVRGLLRVLPSPALRDQLAAIPGYRHPEDCGTALSRTGG